MSELIYIDTPDEYPNLKTSKVHYFMTFAPVKARELKGLSGFHELFTLADSNLVFRNCQVVLSPENNTMKIFAEHMSSSHNAPFKELPSKVAEWMSYSVCEAEYNKVIALIQRKAQAGYRQCESYHELVVSREDYNDKLRVIARLKGRLAKEGYHVSHKDHSPFKMPVEDADGNFKLDDNFFKSNMAHRRMEIFYSIRW